MAVGVPKIGAAPPFQVLVFMSVALLGLLPSSMPASLIRAKISSNSASLTLKA